MKVYRVERRKDAVGPWSERWSADSPALLNVYGGNPSSHDIPGMKWGDPRIFACPDVESFWEYWPSADGRERLVQAGARLSIYEVPNDEVAICRKGSQCVYPRELAVLVGELDPISLEEKEIEECLETSLSTSEASLPSVIPSPAVRPTLPGLSPLLIDSLSALAEAYSPIVEMPRIPDTWCSRLWVSERLKSSTHGPSAKIFVTRPWKDHGTVSMNPASSLKTLTKTDFELLIGCVDRKLSCALGKRIDKALMDSIASTAIGKPSLTTSTATAIPSPDASQSASSGPSAVTKRLRSIAGPTTPAKTNTMPLRDWEKTALRKQFAFKR